jgi:hypothetical protein
LKVLFPEFNISDFISLSHFCLEFKILALALSRMASPPAIWEDSGEISEKIQLFTSFVNSAVFNGGRRRLGQFGTRGFLAFQL